MWLVRGYKRYCDRGLEMNDQRMRQVVDQYERDNDFVQQFPDKRDKVSAIVKKYVVVNKKPSTDYFQVTDPDVAHNLQEEIAKLITETQKGIKKA